MPRRYLFLLSTFFVALLAIGIPIEHKYDKLFRFFSLTLIPDAVTLPKWFDPKIYFYISDLTALFLTFVSLFLFRTSMAQIVFNKGAFFLWIIFIFSIISIIASPLHSYPIPYIRLIQLLTPILIYTFLSQNFSSKEIPKLTHIFLVSLFTISSIEALIAIAQYINQSPLGLRFLGEVNFVSNFHHINTNRWTLDYLFPRLTDTNLLIRPSGTLPHTNVLGGLLCASLLSSYSWIHQVKYKFVAALLFILQFLAMSLTYSRSAFFGWIIGTLIWFSLYMYHKKESRFFADGTLRFLSLSIVCSMTITTTLLYEQILHRGGIVNYNSLAKKSDDLRLYYQDIAFRMIKKKPITGVGFSELSLRTADYLKPEEKKNTYLSGTHNIYLFLAAETGLISLISFLLFIFFLVKSALETPFTPQLGSLFATFITFLFIGGCDFYLILFQQGKLLFFSFAGLLAAQTNFYPRVHHETSLSK